MTYDANDILQNEGAETLRERIDQGAKKAWQKPSVIELRKVERFRLVPFEKLTPCQEPTYLIKGLIPSRGLTVIWGPPKSGKSFIASDMFLHVALGWPYRGRRTTAGTVVYCALEGASGFGNRAEAFRRVRLNGPYSKIPFYLVGARMDLVRDHKLLIKEIRAQLNGKNPSAIVLDTLNRSLRGSESSDEDMAAYVQAADALIEAFDCAVIVVHHCGIDASRPRGHTSLTGSTDAQLSVKRDGENNITLEVEWLKDGPEGARIFSRLEPVELGHDRDGDPISSCVVVPVECRPNDMPSNRKIAPKYRNALEALASRAAEIGRTPPSEFGLPQGLLAISVTEWREELLRRGVLDKSAKNPRTDFKRIKDTLTAKHLIAERDDLVWRSTV